MSNFKKPVPTLAEAFELTEDQYEALAVIAKESVMSSDLKTDSLRKAGARVKLDAFFSEEPVSEYERKLLLVGLMIGEALARMEMMHRTVAQMFGGVDND